MNIWKEENWNMEYIDYDNIKDKLPKNLVLMRHDVEIGCIKSDLPYRFIEDEIEIFGKCVSTFFVRWNYFSIGSEYELRVESNNRHLYDNFINYCIKNNIDVQPHIGIFTTTYHYLKENNLLTSKMLKLYNLDNYETIESLKTMFKNNYTIKNIYYGEYQRGIKYEIKDDIFDIIKLKYFYSLALKKINNEWKNKFGFYPEGYSPHGEGITPNYVYSANTFASWYILLDNDNTYSSNSWMIHNIFKYASDSNKFENKTFDEMFSDEKRIQILTHPEEWYAQDVSDLWVW